MIKSLDRRRYKTGGSDKYYVDCSNYAENADDIHIDGILKETTDVSVLRAVATDDTIRRKHRHIVVKIDRANQTNRKEYDIGERLFRMRIPGFMRYVCVFPCFDAAPHQESGRICRAEPSEKNEKDVLVMPYLSEGSLASHSWDESNVLLLKSLLVQTVMSALIAYTTLGFVHNDLHLDNVLLRRTKKMTLDYHVGGKQYSVATMGYNTVITDFGNSMVSVHTKDQRFFWYDLLNVFSRINLDLPLSHGRKIVWEDDRVIAFVKRARDTDAPPLKAVHLIDIISQTAFRYDAVPSTTYDPHVYG
jgi:serine/threonine protein kinase